MLKKLLIAITFSVTLGGCAQQQAEQAMPAHSEKSVSMQQLNQQQLMGILWMQHSAEYRALSYQAFNLAHERLKRALSQDHDKPLAVVVDVDETVLDNTAYQAWLLKQDHGYESKSWQQWVKSEQATPLPGALGFLNYASENNVEVFYITNRKESLRHATLDNLKQSGFPNVDHAHLLMRRTTSNKAARRATVRHRYDVAVYLGDNLGDFSSQFTHQSSQQRNNLADQDETQWGNKFIVLPNPLYGDWAGAAIAYQWKADAAKRDQLHRQELKSWHPKQ